MLINLSRGVMIDEHDLAEALSRGNVGAAALPELEDYNREYGNILHLADGAFAFVGALRKALT